MVSVSTCRATLLTILLILPLLLQAQENRYMVFFDDKEGGNTYTVDEPSAFLGDRALTRRANQGIAVTEQDLPVTPAYVQGVIAAGATFLYTSKWMNGMLIQCDASLVDDIEALSYVGGVDLVAPGGKPVINGRIDNTGARTSSVPVTDTQLAMIGLDKIHAAGYLGEGIIIAITDAGFDGVDVATPFQHIFTDGRMNEAVSYDFVYKQPDVYQHDSHGTEVLSIIGAYQEGTFVGGAYKASYQLYVTEDIDTEYRIEEYNWLLAAERADSAGADVISCSLGYNTFDDASMNYNKTTDLDGNTAVITRAAQWAADRGIIVVVSAGNEGSNSWGIVTTPADAKDVLAVGSVNSLGVRAGSSSTGPTSDGRIKPDLAAMGAGAAVIFPNGSTGTNNGTSFSAPLISSLVACAWQRFPEKTGKEIMDLLRTTASQANNPDNLLGYGIPNYAAIVDKVEWETQDNLVDVYPNPVTSSLNIRPQDPSQVTSGQIEITTLQGKVLAHQQVDFSWLNNTYVADCSALSAGLYVLRVWIDQKPLVFKFVKL